MAVETIVQPPRTMLEVFDSLPEGTNIQLIENNLVMSPAPLDVHQLYLDLIYPNLSIHVRKNRLGSTRCAPYDVYLDDTNAFQPDICVVLNERFHLIKRNGLHGAPNFVVEILSPGTANYDMNEKKVVYERSGVTEYWIVNTEDRIATGYYLAGDEYHQFFKEENALESKLLGCRIEF
jgi:Uma2 family endonuclease